MYMLNYESIISNQEIPSYIKVLAKKVQTSGGTTLGTWIKNVASADLLSAYNSSLLIKSQQFVEPKPIGELPFSIASSFLTLLDVLSSGEGLDLTETKDSTKVRFNILQTVVSLEMFKRRGLHVPMKYELLTLSEDMGGGLSDHFIELMLVVEGELSKIGVNMPVKFKDMIGSEPPTWGQVTPPKLGFFQSIVEFIKTYRKNKPSGHVES